MGARPTEEIRREGDVDWAVEGFRIGKILAARAAEAAVGLNSVDDEEVEAEKIDEDI